MESIKVSIPAACGEILEGIHQGKAYLASYCIDLYNSVIIQDDGYGLRPRGEKSLELLNMLQSKYSLSLEGLSLIQSEDIPVSKGLASSTSDLAALAIAINRWFNLGLTDLEIFGILCQIEPSDGNLFSQLSLVAFIEGKIYQSWSYDWNKSVALIIPDTSVDSQTYYQNQKEPDPEVSDPLFNEFCQVMSTETYDQLAKIAFRSAQRNQEYLANPLWESLIQLKERPEILGMNIAHSGTIVALWYNSERVTSAKIKQLLEGVIGEGIKYQLVFRKIVAPGPRIESRAIYE